MANIKAAIKHIKTSEKRHQRNQSVKSSTRTYVRKARAAIVQQPAQSQEQILEAIAALDRAAQKGVIHRNNAARRKSRLMKLYHSSNTGS